ncbi:fructosamine kinase family protein [Motilimonas eburnea]|uniref:fructosamine kinase family protein n=1 Tax=Motilimonas eburnea TaxID=1737488 RepID=UPI001E64FE30|nr:fructosamine kinase family protein [Motilimonas eburnea]MCE2570500.1 fructosamine kinase family protein [Motilimonas eburnea]
MWSDICNNIRNSIDSDFHPIERKPLLNGNISHTYRLSSHNKQYFVKINDLDKVDLYVCQADNLNQIAKSQTIQCPQVICYGTTRAFSYLVLEYFNFSQHAHANWFSTGEQIARLHQFGEQKMFGWDTDNYISALVQPNRWAKRWSSFFAEQRIGWQLELAMENGMAFGRIDSIVEQAQQVLQHHKPTPSLLHGNLWLGNLGFSHAEPVIFDSASYWGDREAEIARSRLLQSFPDSFYQGYQQAFPLAHDYTDRELVYQLYYLLAMCNQDGSDHQLKTEMVVKRIMML